MNSELKRKDVSGITNLQDISDITKLTDRTQVYGGLAPAEELLAYLKR